MSGPYKEEWWPKAWKQLKCKYQTRHCELCLHDDLSITSRTTDQIAIRDAVEHIHRLPCGARASISEKDIEFPEFSISFLGTLQKARIEKLEVFNVVSSRVSRSDELGITDLIFRCSNEQLAAGVYPHFVYEEIGRIRVLPETTDVWEWESDRANTSFLYEETWAGGQLYYNLTIHLPERHVPYFVRTSSGLKYSVGMYDEQRLAVHFDHFKELSQISIGYRFAPHTHRILANNYRIIVENQNDIECLIDAVRGTVIVSESSDAPPSKHSKEGKMISILFLAADPSDLSRLRLGQELREIQEKLQLAKLRERFELHQRMSVRPADISQSLLDIQPQIVHFSGHGTNTGALCVENQIGETHPIQPDAVAALFEQFADQVHVVVLNACFSSDQAKAIAKHIDYVIGMNEAIGDKAAIAFAIGFYQALGAGRTAEEAYRLGCVQIRLQNIPEHLTPVLVKKDQAQL